MRNLLRKFLIDERASTAIEYALIGVMISIAIAVGAGSIGNALDNMYGAVGNKTQSAADTIK